MTKFQAGTIHTMDCQEHAIGKAIRPLFADLETEFWSIYNPNTALFLNVILR